MIRKEEIEVAQAFKAGWDRARRDGCVSPELKKALVEHLGIHPDRVGHYMDAVSLSRKAGAPSPNPDDFKTPVVVPFGKLAL